jgi:hypothetical protein
MFPLVEESLPISRHCSSFVREENLLERSDNATSQSSKIVWLSPIDAKDDILEEKLSSSFNAIDCMGSALVLMLARTVRIRNVGDRNVIVLFWLRNKG